MAVPKQNLEWQSEEAPRVATPAGQMPARALQQLLNEQVMAEPNIDRWSRRRSLTFIAASATALWAALIVTAHMLVTAVA